MFKAIHVFYLLLCNVLRWPCAVFKIDVIWWIVYAAESSTLPSHFPVPALPPLPCDYLPLSIHSKLLSFPTHLKVIKYSNQQSCAGPNLSFGGCNKDTPRIQMVIKWCLTQFGGWMAEAANYLCVNRILESRETSQGSYGELRSHPGLQSKQFWWLMRLAGEQFNPHLSVLTLVYCGKQMPCRKMTEVQGCCTVLCTGTVFKETDGLIIFCCGCIFRFTLCIRISSECH